MGYLIVGGSGLLIGIGLLIWALRERSKRADAEKAETDMRLKANSYRIIAEANKKAMVDAEQHARKLSLETTLLRSRLLEARKRLAACDDPEAIKQWLDSELKGETL